MSVEPEAHWALLGEAIVAFAPRRRRLGPLPLGLHRLPGPAMILGERFSDSPVGPFLSLSIGEPARLGLRPGYYFGTTVVNSQDARRAGRAYWGFPAELGVLRWSSEVGLRTFTWEERNMRFSAEVKRRPLPLLVPVQSMQRRNDGPVVVPSRMRGLVRSTRVAVEMEEDDPLAMLEGMHRGFLISGMVLRRAPARKARGWFSTLRAPIRAAEPGVAGMHGLPATKPCPGGTYSGRRPGAYSSVG